MKKSNQTEFTVEKVIQRNSHNKNKIKIELDLMRQTSIHQNLQKKGDLVNLKSDVDKLGIDKVKTVPLSKLSNFVKIDVVKKTVHDELVLKS